MTLAPHPCDDAVMGPYVAVEVAPARADEGALRAILDACSGALPRGECVNAAELPRSESPAATASVNWGDEVHVHVEVRIAASRESTLVRDLTFSARNPRPERFRSVGLAIATMVDELNVSAHVAVAPAPPATETTHASSPSDSAASSSKPPNANALPEPAKSSPAEASASSGTAKTAPVAKSVAPNAPTERAPLLAFEAGALVGSGTAAAPRLGPFARISYDVQPAFYVSAGFASSFRAASSEPSIMWNELLFGGGARLSGGGVRVEAGIDVAIVSTTASAPSPVDDVSDRQSVWVPGVAFEGRLAWPAHSALAVTLGARAIWLAKAVVVKNAGTEIARAPAYNVGATLGARFAF